MGTCPKCNASMGDDEAICSQCGAKASDFMQTIDSAESLEAAKKDGTLRLSEIDDFEVSGEEGDPQETMQQPPSGIQIEELGDDAATLMNRTMMLPDESEAGAGTMILNAGTAGTFGYDESELREAMGLRSDGSAGQLRKLWQEAIGSSGKDSRQSLRHNYAEASDSVFRRVATRNIADANAPEGDMFDYRIKDKLGEGGMGIVYSAIQTAVNRTVAIKSIRAEKRDKDSLKKQFFYEAEITADLDHPNIPPIYELGTTGEGVLFYSMKLIEGNEWQKVIRKKTRDENIEIFLKIADAIAFAHSRNIIHRDLKPDNAMIGMFGEVYVTDWGLAVNIGKQTKFDFGGTPDYMSPEMASNKVALIGKASDVYLLGAILFQILTGFPPHRGKTALDRLASAMRNEIAPTESEDPLLAVAMKAMAGPVTDRYESVEQLQAAIREIRKHEESITLTQRADDIAVTAIDTKDYERFNRSIYGFREAIDLWKDNKKAEKGLQRVRLAYGQCAFDKRDYDLVLQTLDRSVAEESDLYEKAAKAKKQDEQRLQRFKTLIRTFVASIGIFSIVAVGLAGVAWVSKIRADAATKLAKDESVRANAEAVRANEETVRANEEKKIADSEKLKADEAKKFAEGEQKRAEEEKTKAEDERKKADELRIAADDARSKADTEAKNARIAEADARTARRQAELNLARVNLGESIAKTSVSKLQLEKADVRGAASIIDEIRKQDTTSFGKDVPKFDGWATKRLDLLANSDVQKLNPFGALEAVAFSADGSVGAAASKEGKICWLLNDQGKMSVGKSTTLGSGIRSIALSPAGDQLVIAAQDKAYTWSRDAEAPKPIDEVENRAFQLASYSPDGKMFAMGNNQGLWVFPRGEASSSIRNVRGSLKSIHWLKSGRIVAHTELENKPYLFSVDLTTKSGETLKLPDFAETKLSSLGIAGDTVLLGTQDGKLAYTSLDSLLKNEKSATLLPPKHTTGIAQIVANQGRFLTLGSEPVCHLWKIQPANKGIVDYETYLTGTPGDSKATANLYRAAFLSEEDVALADEYGNAFALNVPNQKHRRQITRIVQGEPQVESSPVIGIYPRGESNQVVSINSQGVVELWNSQTGEAIPINNSSWSYFGHTPGATLVDTAISPDGTIAISAALLKSADRQYLSNGKMDHEYCMWDTRTGSMLRRWTLDSSNDIDPRISFVSGSNEFFLASDKQSTLVDSSGNIVFSKDDFGTFFAVPNPVNNDRIALVKRSGAVWVWDRSQPEASWGGWPNPFLPVIDDGTPFQGAWSADGERLYVVFSNGGVLGYEYKNNALVLACQSNISTSVRVSSHNELDIVVKTIENQDELSIVARVPSASMSQSILVTLKTPIGLPTRTFDKVEAVTKNGTIWLSTAGEVDQVHPKFRLNSKSGDRIVSRLVRGNHVYVSTVGGRILDLTAEAKTFTSFGRLAIKDSTADRNASQLWTLHNDGSLQKLDLSGNSPGTWTRATFAASGADQMKMSPDGTLLSFWNQDTKRLRIVSSSDGSEKQSIDGVLAFLWDPSQDASYASIRLDGSVESTVNGNTRGIGKVALDGIQLRSIGYFSEHWAADLQRTPDPYIVVHTDSSSDGKLTFVPLTPQADGEAKPFTTMQVRDGVKVAFSPKDSLIVLGDNAGSVSVWFASPRWDTLGQLFELEGHRGANITNMVFSPDGSTLFTSDRADSVGRLFGWSSRVSN